MELLREWFFYGESDLFWIGIGIFLLALLVPVRREKATLLRSVVLLALYLPCELVVSCTRQNWTLLYLCLLAGGVLFAVAVGRLVRLGVTAILNRKSRLN